MLLIARRVAAGVVGAGAVLIGTAPMASAEPPANCSAADLSRVNASVSAATSDYLFQHPPVNDFFTSLHDVPREEIGQRVDEYYAANPQTATEMNAIRKPLQEIRLRCGDVDGDGDVDIL